MGFFGFYLMSLSTNLNQTLITLHGASNGYLITPFLYLNDKFVFSRSFTAKYFSSFILPNDTSIKEVRGIIQELHHVLSLMETEAEIINTMSYLTLKNTDNTAIYTDMTNDIFLENRRYAVEVIKSLKYLPNLATNKAVMMQGWRGDANKIVHDLNFKTCSSPQEISYEVSCFHRLKNSQGAVFKNGILLHSKLSEFDHSNEDNHIVENKEKVSETHKELLTTLLTIPAVVGLFC